MRLSQLLKLKLELQEHNSKKVELALSDSQNFVNQMSMGASRLPEADFFQKINAEYKNITPLLRKIEDLKQDKIKLIESQVGDYDKQYFVDSYTMYEKEHRIADVATNRDIRKLYVYDNVKEIIKSRIYHYVNWKYPALEIGPGDGEYTEEMAAGDPLYIVDIHQEFLDSTKKRFNEFYATRRLRPYLVKNDYDLSSLPQKQMGFVLAWNLFNYFPLEAIKDYLIEIKKTMRPGGHMIFSYNNSERWQCAEMVENAFMCHTPKSMLVPLVESLGFEVIASYDYDPTVSWIEIHNPGELNSCKGHQAMGQVIQILDPDEDPRSLEARIQEELRVSLKAIERFEINRNRPDLMEKAKNYRTRFNVTLEQAIERTLIDQGFTTFENIRSNKDLNESMEHNMTKHDIEARRQENLRLVEEAKKKT